MNCDTEAENVIDTRRKLSKQANSYDKGVEAHGTARLVRAQRIPVWPSRTGQWAGEIRS